MKYFEKKTLLKKSRKNDVKVGVGNMKIKTFVVLFLNARLISKLMLCNQNLPKLVYPTLLSLNCSA